MPFYWKLFQILDRKICSLCVKIPHHFLYFTSTLSESNQNIKYISPIHFCHITLFLNKTLCENTKTPPSTLWRLYNKRPDLWGWGKYILFSLGFIDRSDKSQKTLSFNHENTCILRLEEHRTFSSRHGASGCPQPGIQIQCSHLPPVSGPLVW